MRRPEENGGICSIKGINFVSENWYQIGQISDLKDDEPIAIEIEGRKIAAYLLEDEIFALDDICPHEDVLLSSGFSEGDQVICPKHKAAFQMQTGKCTKGPGPQPPDLPPLGVHEVKVENDKVFIRLTN
jgi:nitrite reductase/ring-hydroxylating ferredoxin subunit